jgi:hypothetical protein
MTTDQLIKVLRKEPGNWCIWQDYACGDSPWAKTSYEFAITKGKVSAIAQRTVDYSRPITVEVDRFLCFSSAPRIVHPEADQRLDWVDSKGQHVAYHPPDTSVWEVMDVRVFETNADGNERRNGWWSKIMSAVRGTPIGRPAFLIDDQGSSYTIINILANSWHA